MEPMGRNFTITSHHRVRVSHDDSRTGDPATGDFSDAKVIKKFGDVPDLSAL
jgi:hypothetical protein